MRFWTCSPDETWKIKMTPPESAEASNLPSGLNATLVTGATCSANVRISFPVETSQSLTVLSALPVARVLRKGGGDGGGDIPQADQTMTRMTTDPSVIAACHQ